MSREVSVTVAPQEVGRPVRAFASRGPAGLALLRRMGRWLRAPRFILGLMLAVAVMAAALTLAPPPVRVVAPATQERGAGSPNGQLLAEAEVGGWLRSPWFLGVVLLGGLSLAVVQTDQWRRAVRQLRRGPDVASFGRAPFRREFLRPARGGDEAGRRASVRTTGRLALLGSPVFHLGLFLLILAGLARLLFGRDALVELFEGETLTAEPSAYAVQWGGPLSRPFALPGALTVDALGSELYPSGALRELRATVSLRDGAQVRRAELAINDPLSWQGRRLYLTSIGGPAALVEYSRQGRVERRAVFLRSEAPARFKGAATLGDALELRLGTGEAPEGRGLTRVEVRVLRAKGLLYAGTLEPGQGVRLGPAEHVVLRGLRRWARFEGSRDAALFLAFVGLGLVVLGAGILFTVIRVETAVTVVPEGGEERVTVALRASRFAPLFGERFARLVRAEGGGEA